MDRAFLTFQVDPVYNHLLVLDNGLYCTLNLELFAFLITFWNELY